MLKNDHELALMKLLIAKFSERLVHVKAGGDPRESPETWSERVSLIENIVDEFSTEVDVYNAKKRENASTDTSVPPTA